MKTFPASLLLEKRRCLVVGGGKVAARKIGALRDAGADVRVVASELNPAAEEACRSAGAALELRAFQDSDLDGAFLVFAATDSSALNARIVALCKERGALCCASDASWPDGSFITPASFESDGVKISVSTGGASCRKSKLLKELLARHVKSVESADLLVAGFDHNSLKLDQRNSATLSGERLEKAERMLSRVRGLHEFATLSTCNRFELLGVASPDPASEELALEILGFAKLPEGALHVKRGWKAFEHLALLASGMLSQTPGEKHVVAQLKASFERAKENGNTGSIMQEWLDAALRVAKDVRAEMEPLFRACEIDELAVAKAERKFGSLKGVETLVAGSGEIGTAVAKALQEKGAKCVWLHRSRRPEESFGARLEPLERLKELLPGRRLLVLATSSDTPLLDASCAGLVTEGSLIIDLASPRNADPSLDASKSFEVVDLDSMKLHRSGELPPLDMLLRKCEETIGKNHELHEKIFSRLKGGDPLKPALADSN